MSEEEQKAIENVKNMFEGITIDSLNKKSKMTIYCLGIADILLFINAFDEQQKEIEEEHKKWKELLHEYGVKCQEIEKQKDLYEKLFNAYNERVKEIEKLKEYKWMYEDLCK